MSKHRKYANRTYPKRNAVEQKQQKESKVVLQEKKLSVRNITDVKVVHDKSDGRCTIFNADEEVIAEEYADKVTLNFAERKATFLTNSSMLVTYDLETGNQIV